MQCDYAENWLMQAETLHPECWPADLAEHVAHCADCSQMARELRQIEDDWRHRPVPPEAEEAQAAFLQRLPGLHRASRPPRRRWASARWAAAAAILLGVGALTWISIPGQAVANQDIVERLIDWNLALNAADLPERQRLLAEREPGFRQDLLRGAIAPEERELAEKLLADGVQLAKNDDPLEAAKIFSDNAGTLVLRVETAYRAGNERDTERCAWHFQKMDSGMHHSMERAAQMKPKEGEKNPGFEQMRMREQMHRQQFDQMMRQAPPQFQEILKKFRPPHGREKH